MDKYTRCIQIVNSYRYVYTTNSFCYKQRTLGELLQIKVGEMADTLASLPSIIEYNVMKSRKRR